jgi:decaprenylphospho-beta-D-ribofuranose 2-oxidase
MSDAEHAPVAVPTEAASTDRSPPRPPRERTLSGWGRVAPSRAGVIEVRHADEIAAVLDAQRTGTGGVIARGAGRSYGDAAQNAGGTVLDLTTLDRIISVAAEQGLVRVQAGVSYAQLLTELAAHNLTLPVVPGTRHVTVGGAIASDVHGKSHPRDGSLARHVVALRICTPAGGWREITPDTDPELFLATLGGMGLLGVIVEATLRVERLDTPWWSVDSDRTGSLEETLALMRDDRGHRYAVAWLDLLAGGPHLGRAVVVRSNDWGAEATHGAPVRPRRRRGHVPSALSAPSRLRAPRGFPGALLAPRLVSGFNTVRWHASIRSQRGRRTPLATHFFQLDLIADWNRLYGSRGFVQYQFAVPSGSEDELVRCVELLRARGLPCYLAVLKRLGPGSGGPLSFPIEGWTLALDLPAAAPGLRPALDRLDEQVAGCGGRVYLTKDVRLRRDLVAAMYPELPRFHAQRALVDPDGVLQSDLGRRLGLCATV